MEPWLYQNIHLDRRSASLGPTPYRVFNCYNNGLQPRIEQSTRRRRSDYDFRTERAARELQDKTVERPGDLGWPPEFATAWCYRFVADNETEIVDAIDRIRGMDTPKKDLPYLIFNWLDKVLFDGKLHGSVHLEWKDLTSAACGRTSASNVVPGIARVSIELNSLPFRESRCSTDAILDVLIHQMIHAFFLVCCGAQPTEEKSDGRLSDGVQFGVILDTIQEISQQCREGRLPLIFYAHKRRQCLERQKQWRNGDIYGPRPPYGGRSSERFISLNPYGRATSAPPEDGQTHCSHNNRHISEAQIKNWQVERFASAIDLAMDAKGDTVHEVTPNGKIAAVSRLEAPPSSTYVEMVWGSKRITVSKAKARKLASLKKPLDKSGELKLPKDCLERIVLFVHAFIQNGEYDEYSSSQRLPGTLDFDKAPMLLPNDRRSTPHSACAMLDHIRIFKAAEEMGFAELQSHALLRLHSMPVVCEDPIDALKELYNIGEHATQPVHAGLLHWARKFFERTDVVDLYPASRIRGRLDGPTASSNLERLRYWYGDVFTELYRQSNALKEDCRLVVARLQVLAIADSDAMPVVQSQMQPNAVTSHPRWGNYGHPYARMALTSARHRISEEGDYRDPRFDDDMPPWVFRGFVN
ncbi:hypothetical protein LTR09_000555 [Extremus antarcticus]|uniref:SprT-like domain-containing protein n=1 Tax=Extremus antarcticus TaxID=702011 RepID=A0AAJ0GK03_9PEZI|nr:hypothetical protein LTR09_000555 [Extremus antarcticus]